MKFISAKILCFIIALTMILSVTAEAAELTSAITSLNIDGGVTMLVNKTTEESAKGVIAVYNTDGGLEKAIVSEEVNGSGEKTLIFNQFLIKNKNSIVKAFLWKSQDGKIIPEPLSDVFTSSGQVTPEPTPTLGDGIIHLLGDSINADGVENVTVDGTTVTITAAGEYTVEGTLNDGQIVVELASKSEEAVINLNGVNITSTTGAPFAANEGKVEVSAKKGTVNTLKSTAVYTETEEKTPNACLYSRRDLKIKGAGELIVESSFNNGIGTRGDLTIQKATVNVISTANNGIKGNDSVTVTSGTITVNAVGDALKSDEIVDIQGGTLNLTADDEGIQAGESETDETTGETVVTNGVITISETDGTETSVTIISEGDGINSTEGDVTVNGGDITVNSQQDCIQADNTANISGGMLDLTAYGGAPQTVSANNPEAANSCKGIKAGKLVHISGGEFNINTYDDAVHSNHTVRISSGNMDIATGDDGVHGDSYLYISDNANINITKSYEGIEAAKIYVSGGETRVVSSDDGANAAGEEPTDEAYDSVELFAGPGGSWGGGPNWGGEDTSSYGYLEVSGGLLYIEAEGDGFDSNGSGLISGGTVLVNGPTSGGNGVFDVGDNSSDTLTITGGTVIGAGTSDMAVTPNKSQYYVVTSSGGGMGGPGGGSSSSGGLSTQSAGKAFKLANSNGDEIVTYVPSKNYAWVFISTPEMTSGSYTLNYGGSVADGTYTGKGSYGIVTGGTYQGSSSCSLTAVSK